MHWRTRIHTPWGASVSAMHATLSDSAPAQPQMARRAQRPPYRCSHYSSSPGQFAAHRWRRRWWCSPSLHVQAHISQESPPVTQITWPSPAPPWPMFCLTMTRKCAAPEPVETAPVSRKKKAPERGGRLVNECTACTHTQKSLTVILPQSVLAGIPQSAHEIKWVRESVSKEQRMGMGGGGEGSCASPAAALTNAELR